MPTPVDRFVLGGTLSVFLKRGSVEKPGSGVAGWFSSSLGMFAKKIERYSVADFIERFYRFLSDTWLRNVLLVEIDYNPVYQDRKNKSFDDLEHAFRAVRRYVSQYKGAGNKVLISALGKTDREPRKDLHLTVEGQYYLKHGFGKAGVEVKVTGIPSSLLPRKKETRSQFEARQSSIAARLDNARKRAGFRQGCEKTLVLVLGDYEGHLRDIFEVERVDREFAKDSISIRALL